MIEKIRTSRSWSEMEQSFFSEEFQSLSEDQKLEVLDAVAAREDGLFILEKLSTLLPHEFVVWHKLASHYSKRGCLKREGLYFEKAIGVLRQAEASVEESDFTNREFLSHIYWELASTYFHYGKGVGELQEFSRSLFYFQKSHALGNTLPEFYNGWGMACVELFFLTGRSAALEASTSLFRQAVAVQTDFAIPWQNLALALETIYKTDPTETRFLEAHQAFKQAAFLNDNPILFARWGDLLSHFGLSRHDPEQIKVSLARFEQALKKGFPKESLSPRIAEVEASYGALTENAFYLHQAKQRISDLLEQEKRNPNFWKHCGAVYQERANYWEEPGEYIKAIASYEKGVALDPKSASLWYRLATSTYCYALAICDCGQLESAVNLYGQAVNIGGQKNPVHWVDWGIALVKLGQVTANADQVELGLSRMELGVKLQVKQGSSKKIPPVWYYHIGVGYVLLGELTGEKQHGENGAAILLEVLKIDRDTFFYIHRSLAFALVRLGEMTGDLTHYRKAFGHFSRYLARDTEDHEMWCEWGVALLYFHLEQEGGTASFGGDGLDQAEDRLLHARQLGSLWAHYHLARLYAYRVEHVKAMHFLQKALELDALPPVNEIMEGEEFLPFCKTPEYLRFLEKYRQRCEVS